MFAQIFCHRPYSLFNFNHKHISIGILKVMLKISLKEKCYFSIETVALTSCTPTSQNAYYEKISKNLFLKIVRCCCI